MDDVSRTGLRILAEELVRVRLREMGREESVVNGEGALAVLADLAAENPMLMGAVWYRGANRREKRLFKREWRQVIGG